MKFFLFLAVCSIAYGRPGFEEPWGKDSHLLVVPEQKKTPSLSLPGWLMDKAIWFHQNVISPIDGPRSHFRPSSSQYMRLAIYRHGFIKGYLMGCDRLMREDNDPWVYPVIHTEGSYFKWDPP